MHHHVKCILNQTSDWTYINVPCILMHGNQNWQMFISNMWRQGWTMLTECQLALLKRTHRGDRWPTVLESPCTYAHIQRHWQLCWYGSTWELGRWNVRPSENTHTLSAVCVCVCVLVEPCMVVSAHHISAAITPINQWRALHLNHIATKRSLVGTHRRNSADIWCVTFVCAFYLHPSIFC